MMNVILVDFHISLISITPSHVKKIIFLHFLQLLKICCVSLDHVDLISS